MNVFCKFFIFSLLGNEIYGLKLSSQPILEVVTPPGLYPTEIENFCYVGERPRYSTCGAIGWFHGDQYLATVNFEAGAICTYRVDFEMFRCTPHQILYGSDLGVLRSAENLSFNPDESMVAVSINHRSQVNVYPVDKMSHLIGPDPIVVIKPPGKNVHGVRFANQSKYLVCTAVRGSDRIFVYKYNERATFSLVSFLDDQFIPYKAKSIDFTKDDSYLAIVFASNVTSEVSSPGGLVAIYPFDKKRGKIGLKPTSVYFSPEEFKGGEDIRFYKDDSLLFISDHVHDKIVILTFDKTKGEIGERVFETKNPQARISFPHGLGLSQDGNFVGISNYGTDSFSIYRLESGPSR